MKFTIAAFEAIAGSSVEEQASDCLKQMNLYISEASIGFENVISINFFLSATDSDLFNEQTRKVASMLPGQISESIPVAYLAQAPANGNLVSAEVYFVPNLGDSKVVVRSKGGYIYLVVQNNKGEKVVIANGIGEDNKEKDITGDAEKVFEAMKGILQAEGLDFGHIFRQWNYIEDITIVDSNEKSGQHYQQFNNVRSKYYSGSEFKQGYPAATGIGIRTGGVIVSFFAATPEGHVTIPLENPLQKAASEYTEEVLVGDAEYQGSCKCTPKFARAKIVANHESDQVFISGTASIRDEVTVGEDDVARQTEITLDNILKLICKEVLSALDQSEREFPMIQFIRVYIKHPVFYPVVKKICEQRLPGVPGIYVVSDVCRENLLVEIEALATS